jgi:hypothetical protein
MIVISGIILLVIGGIGGYQLAGIPKIQKLQQNKAIQKEFGLEANEYTYFPENEIEGAYILSQGSKEYRIKFSDNKPMRVVYVEEVEFAEDAE